MQHGARRLSVPRGATDLLGVGVERLGDVGVHDAPDVGLVDAHPERGGRHDHVQLARAPGRMHLVAPLLRHSPVVRRGAAPAGNEFVGVRVGLLAGRDVEERGALGIHDLFENRTTLVGVVLVPANRQVDLRTVHAAHLEMRVAHAQARDDVVTDRTGCRRRQRQNGRVAEGLDGVPDAGVLRAEVEPPGRHAVRFVDDDHAHVGAFQTVEDVGVGELLRGEERVHRLAALDRGPGRSPSARSRARIQGDGGGGVGCRVDRRDLVALEGEQRGDDDRDAAQFASRDLIDRGFPRAGGEDDEGVATADDGVDRLGLSRQQRVPPEGLAGGAGGLFGGGGSVHGDLVPG